MSELWTNFPSGPLVEMREIDINGRDERLIAPMNYILNQAFSLDERDVLASISHPQKRVFGRLEEGFLTSVALVSVLEDSAEINYIATSEILRGSGRGEKLIEALESELKLRQIKTLNLYCSDTDRYEFYGRQGFEQLGASTFIKLL